MVRKELYWSPPADVMWHAYQVELLVFIVFMRLIGHVKRLKGVMTHRSLTCFAMRLHMPGGDQES